MINLVIGSPSRVGGARSKALVFFPYFQFVIDSLCRGSDATLNFLQYHQLRIVMQCAELKPTAPSCFAFRYFLQFAPQKNGRGTYLKANTSLFF